jgi:hypothetical protein
MSQRALWLGIVSLFACTPEAPPDAVSAREAVRGVDPSLEWIFSPDQSDGYRGPEIYNCTFKFPTSCDPARHADAVCWEHPAGEGHDGYFKEIADRVHCRGLPTCNGGEGDIHSIRICLREAIGHQMQTPCGPTGPNGCARCWIHSTCGE